MVASEGTVAVAGHEEEMEVAGTMVTMEKDAAGVGTVRAGCEDEDNETG
jgi:hypothetical protein